VLLYELLSGHAPFESSDVMKTYRKILRVEVKYSSDKVDPLARDLIGSMLRLDPAQRLPYAKLAPETPSGVRAVKEHEWFRRGRLNWRLLKMQRLRPPFEPFAKKNHLLPYLTSRGSGGAAGPKKRAAIDNDNKNKDSTSEVLRGLRKAFLPNFAEVPDAELEQHNYVGRVPADVEPGWDDFF